MKRHFIEFLKEMDRDSDEPMNDFERFERNKERGEEVEEFMGAKYEEFDEEEEVSVMTKEAMKDIGKAIGSAFDRLLSDYRGKVGGTPVSDEDAARMIQDVTEDYLRRHLGKYMRY